jgi:predicted DNA-binding protein (MmcQ/YjbR family)
MNIEELNQYCMSLKGTTESFPFDDDCKQSAYK